MSKVLNYIEHGLPLAEKPPVLVLIHGLFGSADNLSVVRRAFTEQYRVISIDLPDHGKSPRSSGFDFADWAQSIALTLVHLKVDKANFVAHSLGGKIAMYLAYLQPMLVDKMVILDIAPVHYNHRHQNVISGLSAVNLVECVGRKSAQAQLAEFVQDAGIQGFLLKSLYQDEDGAWAWRFNLSQLIKDYDKLTAWPFIDEQLFDRPILFIKGKHSDYITSEHQALILKQFPKAEARIVDAGHWLHAEKPQIINRLITKHLHGE